MDERGEWLLGIDLGTTEIKAGVQLIVAHVVRAYCTEDIGDAFDVLRRTRRTCFDISANTHETTKSR